MDYKKTNAPATTVTRDMMELCADTGNVYETVAIIGKRANQISVEIKNEPDLIATQEYIEGKIYYRNPAKEKEKLQ